VRNSKSLYLPGLLSSRKALISHGGELNQGKRKTSRPIDPKQSLHVVLRSSQAKGKHSLLHPKHCDAIHRLTHALAKRWGIKLYRYANVGNHLHLLVKVPSRAVWQRFLKELAGGIAILVTGARKGQALRKNSTGRGFWDHLAFTRIVYFGRDFAQMGSYIIKNLFESAGVPMKRLLAQGFQILTIGEAPG
jgi:hypothetical protein